jgi:hypothetical protein
MANKQNVAKLNLEFTQEDYELYESIYTSQKSPSIARTCKEFIKKKKLKDVKYEDISKAYHDFLQMSNRVNEAQQYADLMTRTKDLENAEKTDLSIKEGDIQWQDANKTAFIPQPTPTATKAIKSQTTEFKKDSFSDSIPDMDSVPAKSVPLIKYYMSLGHTFEDAVQLL